MYKKILFLSIFLLHLQAVCLICPAQEPGRFMEELDKLDLQELRAYISHYKAWFLSDTISAEAPVWDFSGQPVPYTYAPQEEKYVELPRQWDRFEAGDLYDEYFSSLRLHQTFSEEASYIELYTEGEDVEAPTNPVCELRTIWYRDGGMGMIPEFNILIKGSTGLKMPLQAIDSVEISAYYSYTLTYDVYTLNNNLEMETGYAEVISKENNRVIVLLRGSAKYGDVIALNSEGQSLTEGSSFVMQRTPEYDSHLALYGKAFEELERKAQRLSDARKLREEIRKTIGVLPALWEEEGPPSFLGEKEDNIRIYIGYYEGNVDSVHLYMADERWTDRYRGIIVNSAALP